MTTAVLKCFSEPVSFSTQIKNRCYEHAFFNFKKHLFLFLPALPSDAYKNTAIDYSPLPPVNPGLS